MSMIRKNAEGQWGEGGHPEKRTFQCDQNDEKTPTCKVGKQSEEWEEVRKGPNILQNE